MVVQEHSPGIELPPDLHKGIQLRVEALQTASGHEVDLAPVGPRLEVLQHRIGVTEELPVVGFRLGGQGDDGAVMALELASRTRTPSYFCTPQQSWDSSCHR